MPNFPRRSDIHRRTQEASSPNTAASEPQNRSASSPTPPSARPRAHATDATPKHSAKAPQTTPDTTTPGAGAAKGADEAPAAKAPQTPAQSTAVQSTSVQPTSARPGPAFRPVRQESIPDTPGDATPRAEFAAIVSAAPAGEAPATPEKAAADQAQPQTERAGQDVAGKDTAGEKPAGATASVTPEPAEHSSRSHATGTPSSPAAASPAPVQTDGESPEPGEDEDVFLATTGIRSRRLEQERQRARRRRRARRIRAFFIVLIVLALLSAASYYAWQYLNDGSSQSQQADDYSGPGGPPVTVTIYKGALGSDIGKILVENGVVKSEAAFVRAFEANKASNSIRPGTYSLKSQISASDAVAALLDDKNRSENNVTVIPGDTVAQVVQRMKDVTEFDAAAVDAAVANTAALGLPTEANGKLEGWLAPGTYELSADSTPEALFKDMVAERIKELDALKIAPADRQTVLIKASILEREVDRDEYLPKVARVIENRLADPTGETRGLLQMDSTVAYAVGRTSGVPTLEELAVDSPYNTYKVKGLPVGAISNPHVKAIEATLNPEPGGWLYFVSIDLDTGETRFSSTLAEHEQAKALLDQYCATHGSKCHQ